MRFLTVPLRVTRARAPLTRVIMRSFARLFVVALAGTRVADTKFVRGTVDTIQAWKYITRFCFTPLPRKARDATEERALKKYGRFDFEVRFPNGARPILALHYNGFNNWDKVYKTDDSCFARINKPGPHMQPKVIELIEPDWPTPFIDKVTIFDTETKVEGHTYFEVRSSRRADARRARARARHTPLSETVSLSRLSRRATGSPCTPTGSS